MRGSHEEGADVALARAQMRELLQAAVADLPRDFRTVFVMREVEGMSPEVVAEALGIPTSTVKTRLFRARKRLQKALAPEVHATLSGAFPFAGADCAVLSELVVNAICGFDRPVA